MFIQQIVTPLTGTLLSLAQSQVPLAEYLNTVTPFGYYGAVTG